MMSTTSRRKPADATLLRATFFIAVLLNVLFLWNQFLPHVLPSVISAIDAALGAQRAGVMIAELIAAIILFVDMVTRFDDIPSRLRAWHVIGVGFVVFSWIFQLFVYFLDSALSMA